MRVVDMHQVDKALAALPATASISASSSKMDDDASLQGEPRVVASGNHATPRALLAALDRARERYRLFMLAAHGELPQREGVVFETPFVGPAMRDAGECLDYLPTRLSLVPRLFATLRPPDVALVHTSLPFDGKVSLGIEVNVLVAAIEHVRARGGLVVAQLNPHMPYTFGDGELDEELIDLAVEVPEALSEPVSAFGDGSLPTHAQRIAELVAELVGERATLQLGIGNIPDATVRALAARRTPTGAGAGDGGRLGVWSEMISDGVLGLERRGLLDTDRPIVCSFMFGTRELYEWVHRNPRVRMARTETANDPAQIAARPEMVAVNTALQVDLFDQAGASHVAGRVYSGFGGQPDFVSGALHSSGGQAVIALCSWHERSATSTIVPRLEVPATSFQHSAVVTEQGCAHIFGCSQRAQARLMIEHAAHPDAREELFESAVGLGLALRR